MNKAERQVIAEKVSSTIRVLELLGFEYQVLRPRNERKKGNKSPRVIYVYAGGDPKPNNLRLRIYNSAGGHTWANRADGKPIKDIGTIEELYDWLSERPLLKLRSKTPK
jgi:hypothetical protein